MGGSEELQGEGRMVGYNAVGRTKAPEQQKAQTGGDDETWAGGKAGAREGDKDGKVHALGAPEEQGCGQEGTAHEETGDGQGYCRVGPSAEEAISR